MSIFVPAGMVLSTLFHTEQMVQPEGLVAMQMLTAGKWIDESRGGFTLFELVVVITILAVMAGFVVPVIDFGINNRGVDDTMSVMRSAMDMARTQARLTRSPVQVSFTPSAIMVGGDNRAIHLPESSEFSRIVFAEEGGSTENSLVVDRRGIVSAAIVLVKLNEDIYSFFISPVVRNIEYKKGVADFSDFINR